MPLAPGAVQVQSLAAKVRGDAEPSVERLQAVIHQPGTPGTTLSADWYNDIQENILAVLAAVGITPTKGRAADLLDALQAMQAVPYVLIRHRENPTVSAAAFPTGAWRTRPLNQIVTDTAGIAGLASNQITLPAGTYRASGFGVAHDANVHKARLRNITAGATLLVGSNKNITDNTGTSMASATASWVRGRFTLAAPSVLEFQHHNVSAGSAATFGTHSQSGEDEVYAILELWKIS